MSASAANLTNEEYEERKVFLEELKKLVKVEQEEIFRILKKNKCDYSENSNGVFILCVGDFRSVLTKARPAVEEEETVPAEKEEASNESEEEEEEEEEDEEEKEEEQSKPKSNENE